MGRGWLRVFSHSNGQLPCSFSVLSTSPRLSQPMISRPEGPGTSTILILIVPGRSMVYMCMFRRLKRSFPTSTISSGLWKSAEEASETSKTQKLLIEWTLRATTGLHHPFLKLKKEKKNFVPLDNLASSAQRIFPASQGTCPLQLCTQSILPSPPHPTLQTPTSLSASELRIRD